MSLYRKKIVATIEVEAVHHDTSDSIAVCEEKDADMFSVYLRTEEGLATCIADFDVNKKDEAIKFADEFESAIKYGNEEVEGELEIKRVEVPSVDEIIKRVVLGGYFSEIHDEDALLTELVESEDEKSGEERYVEDLEHGDICEAHENEYILNVWNEIEGDAQEIQRFISGIFEK